MESLRNSVGPEYRIPNPEVAGSSPAEDTALYRPNWSRTSTSTGYAVVHCPDHPKAWSTGYLYVHRVVAELALGRYLTDDEIVHHRDGNKANNAVENLEVLNHRLHGFVHAAARPGAATLRISCPQCGKEFLRVRRQTHVIKGGKATFCGRVCAGKFNGFKKAHM